MTILSNNLNNTAVVILAAGHGKRMQSTIPKVLMPLHSQPLLEYVVKAAEQLECVVKPVVVVNVHATEIQDRFGDRIQCVVQHDQLGTGHAVQSAYRLLNNRIENILVLNADMPFVSSVTLKKMITEHEVKKATLTLATTNVPDFDDWRVTLKDFGRIVWDGKGKILKIVEAKDATLEQLQVCELNTGIYIYKANWLWAELSKLKYDNAQGEQYLTDLVGMAVVENESVANIVIDAREAVGINTKENLSLAHNL